MLVLLFLVFGPGLAIAELLLIRDPVAQIALATAASLAIETIVAVTLLYLATPAAVRAPSRRAGCSRARRRGRAAAFRRPGSSREEPAVYGGRLASADDNDMGLRLLDAGCEVHHVPAVVVLHRAWRSPRERERARMRWTYGRGKGAFYAKHMQRSDPYADATARRRPHRVHAARRSLPRAPGTAAGHALYLAGIASGAAEWILRQRRRRPAEARSVALDEDWRTAGGRPYHGPDG